jgi:hypothetical protein
MMAGILTSKVIHVKRGNSFDFDTGIVGEWLNKLNIDADVDLVISVRTLGGRQRKLSSLQILQQLLIENPTTWEKYEYKFDFSSRQLFWKDGLLHFTAGEELFLYRWLVLNQRDYSQMYFIHNIRRRYGKEFLQEVSHA